MRVLFERSKLVLFTTLAATTLACQKPAAPTAEQTTAAEPAANQPAVTVGYQGMLNPWKVAIQNQSFEKATGRTIQWRKFSSGSEVITAMASGDVHIAVAGSSPIATAMSRGLELELVWILEAIKDNEALVVRNDAGIEALQDLKGKSIGVPFASTTHYHMLYALERANIATNELTLLNLQPDAILASWTQQRIDAAFVWSPALDELKKTGKVILTSGELAAAGKPTFDGLVAQKSFAHANPEFMAQFLQVIAQTDANYRDNRAAWTADSAEVLAISQFTGAATSDVAQVLALYEFPALEEQLSDKWLGGGAARAISDTAAFLKAQKKIADVLPDYAAYVNPQYAAAAAETIGGAQTTGQ